ncbi:MAG: hypothetical protein ACKOAR_14210 [Bacteroidota bacterium]
MSRLALLFVFCSVAYSYGQEYTVIGNETAVQSLTSAELKNVFKPRNSLWTNGRSVTIVLPGTTSPIRDRVARDIYNSSFVAMQKYWLSLVFQGRFSAPVILNSDEETINFVKRTPGAIGFIQDASLAPSGLIIKLKSEP